MEKSKSATFSQQLRYQKWIEEVKSCESRPSGMSVASWCRENNIKSPTYYDHLHKVRELCLDQMDLQICTPVVTNTELDVVETTRQPSFVELPIPVTSAKASTVTINLGHSKIEITEDVSEAMLMKVIGAICHAQ